MNMDEFFDRFYIVVEMTPAPDCRFVGSWLLAKAAALVSQMRAKHTFARLISTWLLNRPSKPPLWRL